MWNISQSTIDSLKLTKRELAELERYKSGDLLDSAELEKLVPMWRDVSGRFVHPSYKQFYYGKRGIEVSTCWSALRSRICADNGAAKMYVIVPTAVRAHAIRETLMLKALHERVIEVVEDYPANLSLQDKVDFIIFEPNDQARATGLLSTEDAFILELIRRKNLFSPVDDTCVVLS